MNSFAIYRLPHGQRFTLVGQTSGEARRLGSFGELGRDAGFALAPFEMSAACPLLLIRPDVVRSFDASEAASCRSLIAEGLQVVRQHADDKPSGCGSERDDYHADFARFYDELASRRLLKVVLSRCSRIDIAGHDSADPFRLFLEACRRYPRLFVALVATPQSGLWLAATPEILLDGQSGQWRTIALAGTMQLAAHELQGEGEQARWSAKNIEEQRLVATYIKERLQPLCSSLSEEGPRTVRAANLVHLRSDFSFTLLNKVRVGDVVSVLPPTPAVCGLPQDEARRFILAHEHTPRRYYSGFMGPVGLDDATHLYVSLRCMQVMAASCRLYAGGGLLRDSIEEEEWQETEAKLQTMKQLFQLR